MPHKQKVSSDIKVALVKRYLRGEVSTREAARLAGVDRKAIWIWIRQYETEGEGAFLPPKRNRVYPPEIKISAVKEYLMGTASLNDICRKYGIRSDVQLRSWIKVYNAHGDFNSVKQSGGGSYMKQGRNTT